MKDTTAVFEKIHNSSDLCPQGHWLAELIRGYQLNCLRP